MAERVSMLSRSILSLRSSLFLLWPRYVVVTHLSEWNSFPSSGHPRRRWLEMCEYGRRQMINAWWGVYSMQKVM